MMEQEHRDAFVGSLGSIRHAEFAGVFDSNPVLVLDSETYHVVLQPTEVPISGVFFVNDGLGAEGARGAGHAHWELSGGSWNSVVEDFGTGEFIMMKIDVSVAGDFDDDRELSVADIDLLSTAIRQRENPQQLDINLDGVVDLDDSRIWVEGLKQTWFGDANLDGEFNSTDLVQVFAAGEYEDTITDNSTWADGDWNADSEFDSGDLVEAFASGGFESGPRTALRSAPVPEPSSFTLVMLSLLAAIRLIHDSRFSTCG